jgi:predicted metalloenzyme YecM
MKCVILHLTPFCVQEEPVSNIREARLSSLSLSHTHARTHAHNAQFLCVNSNELTSVTLLNIDKMLFEDLTKPHALKLWIINCITLYYMAQAVTFLTCID